MGTDSFKAFMKKTQEDGGLHEELRARFGDLSAGVPANELAEFAAGKGYTFTVEELQGELSNAELAGVSGGVEIEYLGTSYGSVGAQAVPQPGGAGIRQRVYFDLNRKFSY
jgi:predicted ribosomally synthesized peptide with nif11-like leader